ncbi:MAG: cytochrome c biogenesis protein CcsA [Spirochaetes bacterium]|nr:cytochrome c biogenesis protein CcsA [Spirochaetota bacterium]
MFTRLRYVLLLILFFTEIYLCFFYVRPVGILGNSIRILFFHVPAAWTSVISFMISLFFSLRYIKTKNSVSAEKAVIVSAAGLFLLIAASVSGAIWAKSAWNSFWNWDVRQTSIAVLILIYVAFFSIRLSVKNNRSRDMISSVYLIFSSFAVPFFVFIAPRQYESLHPDLVSDGINSILSGGRVIQVLVFSILYFSWLYFEIINHIFRTRKNEF